MQKQQNKVTILPVSVVGHKHSFPG